MTKFFTFADRFVPVQFFDGDEAVKVTMKISDETDKRLIKASEAFVAADKNTDMDKRREAYRAALEGILGAEKSEAILSHADEPDCFAIYSVYQHLLREYGAAKTKNLSGSGR
jgi:hypothetical protein